jgi:hypothetical protein
MQRAHIISVRKLPFLEVIPYMPSSGVHFHRAGRLPGQQAAFWCRSCGSDALVAQGLCRTCYDRRWHSLRYFGGLRDRVLERDRCCQLCLSEKRLVVHHRQPGQNRPALQITLCRRCHVPIHRRHQLPGVYSELFLQLWREQHPQAPVQLRLPLA